MIFGADKFGIDLAGDGQNRCMVMAGIIQAIQKMDRPAASRADTARNFTRQFGLCRCGEGTGFFVSDQNKVDVILVTQRKGQIIDGVAGDAKYVPHTQIAQ